MKTDLHRFLQRCGGIICMQPEFWPVQVDVSWKKNGHNNFASHIKCVQAYCSYE